MTDGNTYAINKHLDEREDYDALQETYAELDQAEARIEELEETLSLRTNLHGEATYVISELESKLAKAVEALEGVRSFVRDLALYADQGHTLVPALEGACTTLAELKGQDDAIR